MLQSHSTATFIRGLGSGAGNVQWTANGGGFAAGGGNLSVNIGGGASLEWESSIKGTLLFGSATSNGVVTFANPLNLGTQNRTILVDDSAVMSGVLSGSGNLTKEGDGTLTLSGLNSYTGKTIITGGVLAVNADNGLGSYPATFVPDQLTLNGGMLQTSETFTLASNRGITLGANGGTFAPNSGTILTVGQITGSSSLTMVGAGTLALGAANADYSGTTTVNNSNGTLTLKDQNALQHSTLVLTSGSLIFDSSVDGAAILGGLRGAGSFALQDNAGTPNPVALSVGNNDEDTEYSGVLTGTGSLTKIGSGTLTLAGSNIYTGGTTVTAGTLLTQNGNALPKDGNGDYYRVDVNSGATLAVNANDWNCWTPEDINDLLPDQQPANVTFDEGSTFEFVVNSYFEYDYSIPQKVSGLRKSGSGTLLLAGTNTYTGTTTISDGALYLYNNGTSSGTLSSGPVVVDEDGSLVVYCDATLPNAISGSGAIEVMLSPGTLSTLILTGDNSGYSGTITVDSSATLQIGDATTPSPLGHATITYTSHYGYDSGGTVVFCNVGTTPVTCAVTGSVNVVIAAGCDFSLGDNPNNLPILPDGTSGTGVVTVNGRLDLNGHSPTIDWLDGVSGTGILTNDGSVASMLHVAHVTDTSYSGRLGQLVDGSESIGVVLDSGDLYLTSAPDAYSGDTTVFGSAAIHFGSGSTAITIQGRSRLFSGTECAVQCSGFIESGADYAVEVSTDGTNYTKIIPALWKTDWSRRVGDEQATLLAENLPRVEDCHVRVVATAAYDGRRTIYDMGSVATIDLPDTSGWYRIDSIVPEYPGADPLPGEFYDKTSWVYAGSAAGAAFQELSSLMTDDSLPDGNPCSNTVYIYEYMEFGGPERSFQPGSAPTRFTTHTTSSTTNGALPTTDPILYFNGDVDYSVTDLESDSLAESLAQSRSWTTHNNWSAGQRNGNGWLNNELPVLKQGNGDAMIYMIRSATLQEGFIFNALTSEYEPEFYGADALTHDTVNHEFVWTDYQGSEIRVFDFSDSTVGLRGTFKSMTDASGLTTSVTTWTADGAIGQIQRRAADNSVVEQWDYSYISSGPNAGLLESLTLKNAALQTVEQVQYTYYDGSYTGDNAYGNVGDLKTSTVTDGSGNILDMQYYRYYTPSDAYHLDAQGNPVVDGYVGGLKYIFDFESYSRLLAGLNASSLASTAAFTATDTQVAAYANHYFKYDASRRVTLHDVQRAGGTSSDGIGTFTYVYEDANSAFNFSDTTANRYNTWGYKTVETLPDGNTNTVYCNSIGRLILKDFNDQTDPDVAMRGHWYTYDKYDVQGQLIEEYEPSSLTGYSITDVEENGVKSIGVVVPSVAAHGTINVTTYYPYDVISATDSTPGSVQGLVHSYQVKDGSSGSPVTLELTSYYLNTSATSSRAYAAVALDTVYSTASSSSAELTTCNYTWSANEAVTAPTSMTVLAPEEDNGSVASSDATTAVYDAYGRPVWMKDAAGYISYIAYDNATGAVVETIADVDTSSPGVPTGLPSGWSTPSGGGLNLITAYQVDRLGRTVQMTDADGNVTFYVYKAPTANFADPSNEVRVYSGWRFNGTTQKYEPTTNAAIVVSREDLLGNYSDTLSYVWTGTGANALPTAADGSPTGTESLTSVYALLQTLSRTLRNAANQIEHVRDYFNLSGLSYSTARNLGAEGVNYDETDYGYGVWGDTTSVTDAGGHATDYVYNAQGDVYTETDALNHTTTYQYDKDGNCIEAEDALGVKTRYTYNYLDQLVSVCQNYQNGQHDANEPADQDVITQYSYDLLGNLLTVTDAKGVVTKYEYDARGQETAVTENFVGSGVYDAQHPDRNVKTTYAYDAVGQVTDVWDVYDRDTRYTYDALGQVLTVTANCVDGVYDPDHTDEDVTTKYTYDGQGNVLTVTANYIDGAYDSAHPDQDVKTVYTYDALGQCTAVVENYQNGVHAPGEASDSDVITQYAYDAVGDLTDVTDPAGVVTHYVYDALGQQSAVIQNYHDGMRGPTEASDSDIITQYAYDAVGNLTDVTDPANIVTHYVYDALGQNTAIIANYQYGVTPSLTVNVTTGYAYNAVGDLTDVTDPANIVTHYVYDALGRKTAVVQNYQDGDHDTTDDADEDVVTAYTYDTVGNLLTLTDSDGNTTTYGYDALGRVTSETNQLGYARQYQYDALGELKQYTDRNSRVTTYEYDALGRLTDETWGDGHSFSYDYDALGDLLTASDNDATAGSTDSFAYDALGRLTSETQAFDGLTPAVMLGRQYDAVGNQKQLSSQIGGTNDFVNTYSHDDLGRMTSVLQTSNGGNSVATKLVAFSYTVRGQFDTIDRYADSQRANQVASSQYGYDDLGRITSLGHTHGATTLASYQWQYNAVGNMTRMKSSADASTGNTWGVVDYTHDNLGQLQTATYSTFANAPANEDYGYDENGNRTSDDFTVSTEGGTGNNQMATGAGYAYAYDHEGNCTLKFVDADNDGQLDAGDTDITAYTWDYRDRLAKAEHFSDYASYTAATPVSDWSVSYAYDCFNRLVHRDAIEVAGETTTEHQTVFIYDGANIVLQFEKSGDGSLAATNLAHRDLWGAAVDQILADESLSPLPPGEGQGEGFDLSSPGAVLWGLADHEGTIRDIVNNSGAAVDHRVFNSFGKMTSETPAAADFLFAYTGKMLDAQTGLQNNLNRWYDSATGRWISQDPLGLLPDSNPYRYCGNSPMRYTDPSGLAVDGSPVSDLGQPALTNVGGGRSGPVNDSSAIPLKPSSVYDKPAADDIPSMQADTRTPFEERQDELRAIGRDETRSWAERNAAFDEYYGTPDYVKNYGPNGLAYDLLIGPGCMALANVASEEPLVLPRAKEAEGETPTKEGIYEFPDQRAGNKPYVGQSEDVPRRLGQHESAGRLTPGTEKTTPVSGGKTAREIAEHKRIQELTGGVKAKNSPAVANQRDPIGPNRRGGCDLPEPKDH